MSQPPHDNIQWRERIKEQTHLLRTGPDPFWIRLRALLSEKGIDPETSLLVDCFPDDTDFEFGLIVSAAGKCFQFGFAYLNKAVEEGVLSEWRDLTDQYPTTPYHTEVSIALKMLGEKI